MWISNEDLPSYLFRREPEYTSKGGSGTWLPLWRFGASRSLWTSPQKDVNLAFETPSNNAWWAVSMGLLALLLCYLLFISRFVWLCRIGCPTLHVRQIASSPKTRIIDFTWAFSRGSTRRHDLTSEKLTKNILTPSRCDAKSRAARTLSLWWKRIGRMKLLQSNASFVNNRSKVNANYQSRLLALLHVCCGWKVQLESLLPYPEDGWWSRLSHGSDFLVAWPPEMIRWSPWSCWNNLH